MYTCHKNQDITSNIFVRELIVTCAYNLFYDWWDKIRMPILNCNGIYVFIRSKLDTQCSFPWTIFTRIYKSFTCNYLGLPVGELTSL